MAIVIRMPKMSDTMEEGVLVAWLKREGERIEPGDVIAEVETDKATMELEAFDSGVLLKQIAQPGQAIPLGGVIAILGEPGEDISAILAELEGAPKAPAPGLAAEADSEPSPPPDGRAAQQTSPERIKASPLARRMAREAGIPLEAISGTGPEGRIIKRDVEAAVARLRELVPQIEEAPALKADFEAIPISPMRKTIARRLGQSVNTAPHFYLSIDVDAQPLLAARERLNAISPVRISVNDFITKACALALRRHPEINASWAETEIRRYHAVHIAIAVAIEEGLVTPVIRDADRKGMAEIAREAQALIDRAHNRQLKPEDLEGSTFTTSNLGMFGIESFTAIINPPNACILAIGAIRDVPVVEGDRVVPGKRMRLTLSCDHRVVDGAMGARFLNTLKGLLENPLAMLL
ncbi:MAG: pyruvate dehydrogenase complex dihydrolipoamide acetyltransferase [Bacteroidota bacterium]|nr:pyruvate dehydrogenase complex dihydrolipoamide acetyltransferase [Rhodothermia bacterium]MCS7155168.1 pyruvate dehydrogenase complex dihydrolipoamide acetyltransferase [Bacteroidota bacterium]MDW8138332.1 pyruvate dehydrogenase complex dihydrolipoamide acetyltransferase [Bacteroidota bacterium]MDW8286017.1 pyruvate dehydrogenase complex dihydrolipoamide acetyltransferase [Bacteroidota bacterium]